MVEDRDPKQEQERGFVVIDRRGRGGDEEPAEEQAEEAPAPRAGPQEAEPSGEGAAPKVDFSMLVLSFSHSAFYHLGLVEDPGTHRKGPVDKNLARSDIDMLELLQEKTRGNLTPDEEKLLQSLLYDLRMRFVEAE